MTHGDVYFVKKPFSIHFASVENFRNKKIPGAIRLQIGYLIILIQFCVNNWSKTFKLLGELILWFECGVFSWKTRCQG